jgi:hypothetical protein
MTNQNYANASNVGSGGVLRFYLLALALIAAGLGLWAVDDKHQSPSAIFVSDRHNS